ncbi:hypothetical protein EV426DRAFT_720475 [Tirmania nivea]|nr:hypothetical protein EV426DRAFT_720475 [Tirmania nivea]
MPIDRSLGRNFQSYDATSPEVALGGMIQNGSVREANFLGILLITEKPIRVQEVRDSYKVVVFDVDYLGLDGRVLDPDLLRWVTGRLRKRVRQKANNAKNRKTDCMILYSSISNEAAEERLVITFEVLECHTMPVKAMLRQWG